jgi:hypothetical protein
VVVATVRGKANYLAPTLQNVVGRKCLVTEVLEADNITFSVLSSALINTASPTQPSTNNAKAPPAVENDIPSTTEAGRTSGTTKQGDHRKS